ncbi:MAG TPA: DUF3857 domain-containing protein [Ferruginibacter sp.]|nr:DUF3857 domain-containing protein [Ferruginibacter sp.]HMP20889.1 DUF3857 domain-containing protein [Ferruginibacter sp.]
MFFLFFIALQTSFAQVYNAFVIPDSLRKNASVVKRHEEYVLTIQSPAKYKIYEKKVYTILNTNADRYAHYRTYYGRFNSISTLSGKMYNRLGLETRHLKKSDWQDQSVFDGFSLLRDDRYKEYEFHNSDYPYTVEFEEEDEYNATQGFFTWMPQREPGMSVQYSKVTVIAPSGYKLRYKPVNFNTEPLITDKGGSKIYTWEIKNLPAVKYEKGAPPFREITPHILFAPSEFEVSGYKGDMSTWEGYGKFMYQLIKGRDVLPDVIKKQVHELTDTISNPREKINVLYDYLQKNTRYISIQLGIGGWQPFEAAYVAEKKYGDCKALSNYMIALLKEAGITGKYIEIYAGKNPPTFIEDFTFSQANHVICCVPLAKDTVWLECTSQTKAPGYMGNFTGNRKAVLIDESGGRVVHTPVYTAADNRHIRKIVAELDAEGTVLASIQNTYAGLQQDEVHHLMHDASPDERQKYLNQMFNLPTYEVLKSSYKEQKAVIPIVQENLQIRLSNFASITGKRLFITPGLFASPAEKLSPDTVRRYDYVIHEAYTDIDTVEIKIPAGYVAESMPKPVSMQTAFGKYEYAVQLAGDKLVYYRLMVQYNGRFPAAQYNDLVKFYEQVSKTDRTKVVLVKQEQ